MWMDQSSGSTLAQVIPIAAIGLGLEIRSYSQRLRSSGAVRAVIAVPVVVLVALLMGLLSFWETNALNAVAADADGVIIIDSPEFTHPIAKRIRRKKPLIPIIGYVSPSVWAWRPGRARKMAPYVDHLLAILPFEPEAHERLGGPPCSYVGHPMIEKLDWIGELDAQELAARLALDPARPVLLVLPGSRPTEVRRLMQPFGETVAALIEKAGPIEVILPVVDSVRPLIEEGLESWSARPHLVSGQDDKFKAFKLARAALAASGTVTLELGLAGVPMVVAYKVDWVAERFRFLLKVPSVVLANLVIGQNVFPELLQEDCTSEKLTEALLPLFGDTPERERQLAGLATIADKMMLDHGTPSERAAETALAIIEEGVKKRLTVPR
jgi:lipid-A-disaccharide synthase